MWLSVFESTTRAVVAGTSSKSSVGVAGLHDDQCRSMEISGNIACKYCCDLLTILKLIMHIINHVMKHFEKNRILSLMNLKLLCDKKKILSQHGL